MLRNEDFVVIQALKHHDVSLKDIAAELGVHPKTVSRDLRRGSAPSGVGRRRASKLDPYKAIVDRLLGEGAWNVMVILREIQAEGYTGGSTMLQLYAQPKRALSPGRNPSGQHGTMQARPRSGVRPECPAARPGCVLVPPT